MIHYFPDQPLREFFPFKGAYYATGTKVVFSDEFIKKRIQQGKNVWKYAYFEYNDLSEHEAKFRFAPINAKPVHEYCYQDDVYESELEDAIEQITMPVYANVIDLGRRKRDWEVPGLIGGWVVYILSLLGCFLFNEYYVAWGIVTAIFISWRLYKRKYDN